MKVNERQVGGEHYKCDFQHWDLIARNDIGYLEGCATKYIVRWKDKGWVEDLKKARHYTEKLISIRKEIGYQPKAKFKLNDPQLQLFYKSNPQLNMSERAIIDALLCGFRVTCFESALKGIDFLISVFKNKSQWDYLKNKEQNATI